MPKQTPEAPLLPAQLQPDYDGTAAEVFAEWNAKTFDEVRDQFAPSQLLENGERSIRYAELLPQDGEADPEQTVMLSLPVGRTWGLDTFVMSAVAHDLIAPQGRMIVFPNNNKGTRAYTLSKPERKKVAGGDYSPLNDRQLAVMEHLGIDAISLVMGHSQGAAVGASFAEKAGQYVQTRAHMFNEAPNTVVGRTGMALRKAAAREGKELVPAYKAARLAALEVANLIDRPLRYKWELLRFAIGGNLQQPNIALNRSFLQPTFFESVGNMLAQNAAATVLLANALSSTVSSVENSAAFTLASNAYPGDVRTRHDVYDGFHVTAGNPFVMGLLGRRALQWQEQAQIAGRDFGTVGELPAHEAAVTDQQHN